MNNQILVKLRDSEPFDRFVISDGTTNCIVVDVLPTPTQYRKKFRIQYGLKVDERTEYAAASRLCSKMIAKFLGKRVFISKQLIKTYPARYDVNSFLRWQIQVNESGICPIVVSDYDVATNKDCATNDEFSFIRLLVDGIDVLWSSAQSLKGVNT